eukprot:8252845-Pyramimonas_sp.AAC.1
MDRLPKMGLLISAVYVAKLKTFGEEPTRPGGPAGGTKAPSALRACGVHRMLGAKKGTRARGRRSVGLKRRPPLRAMLPLTLQLVLVSLESVECRT